VKEVERADTACIPLNAFYSSTVVMDTQARIFALVAQHPISNNRFILDAMR